MSRVHVHIGRVVAHGDVSAAELTGALQSELHGLLRADPPVGSKGAHVPTVRVAPPASVGGAPTSGSPSTSTLGRLAARAIHGGLKS